ncbi:hypothetical protein CAPTEDRAFT_165514 [Capitella teleta]|uniref:MOSC domain-containing protein n=2 Tax=Capitella teleta TaxID=283909 RepID=R7UNX2_CAPTE|nr:hypothetical protein CAPTEDRAFT_165514 [Capitella teleta]|eukprot:ELU05622.1 hypothetical protein CAPTEDRAFT_165514 [Capitella teleta]
MELTDSASTLLFLASSAILRQVMTWTKRRQRPPHVECVGTLRRIRFHPVKSCCGIEVDEVDCTHNGVNIGGTKDRQWAFVTPDHQVVHAKDEPSLVLIQPSLKGDQLVLTTPSMDTSLQVPRDYKSLEHPVININFWRQDFQVMDCGDDAAAWISKYLGKEGYRMVFSTRLLPDRPVPPQPDKHLFNAAPGPKDTGIGLKNERPYLLGTNTSLDDLNSKLDVEIPMERFRPNFIIDTHCPPYDEDNWREIFIGDAKFSTLSMCDRCPITTVDIDTGTKDPLGEPLKTLRSYRKLYSGARRGPCFNTTLTADWLGRVKVGDKVYVLRDSE